MNHLQLSMSPSKTLHLLEDSWVVAPGGLRSVDGLLVREKFGKEVCDDAHGSCPSHRLG